MISENITVLQNRLHAICSRAGRNQDDITLVAVAKTFAADSVQTAYDLGLRDFGENYVQELTAKRSRLADLPVRWHFVGHLQSNKVKYIVDFIHLIHSVDNMRLAQEINKRAEVSGRRVDVLVEVHTTDEAAKSGVPPEKTLDLIKDISLLPNVRVRGLMTMGPFSEDPNDSRPSFQKVRGLMEEVNRLGIGEARLKELSMGMTHDFEVAIEEGATILRIGTAIFGERKKKQSQEPVQNSSRQ